MRNQAAPLGEEGEEAGEEEGYKTMTLGLTEPVYNVPHSVSTSHPLAATFTDGNQHCVSRSMFTKGNASPRDHNLLPFEEADF